MKIGITGSAGMLGWQTRCYMKQLDDIEVVLADRATFGSSDKLREFVAGVDAIAHLAGQNRGDDAEVAKTNVDLAKALVAACEAEAVTPHVAFSSTIHIDKDNAYGQSKKKAGETIAEWAGRSGARFSNLVLPHIFGEGTKPFYNSAVATFAYQLATGETPEVHQDATLELLHAQDVAALLMRVFRDAESGDVRVPGEEITVTAVLERLQRMADSYTQLVVPDVRDRLDLRLFNLYRSYLFPAYYPKTLQLHTDDRGDLVEVVKNNNGGQAFISTTKPGITRGNHYHYEKIERFLVLQGSARIEIRRLYDDQTHVFNVSGDTPAFIDMPTLHTHNITNTGDDPLLTLFWSHEIFNPEQPDTIFEVV